MACTSWLSGAVLTTAVAVLPFAAMAECRAWELLPSFAVKQDNGYNVTFAVNVASGKVVGDITGSAHYYTGDDFHRVDGKAGGFFNGTGLQIDVMWQNEVQARYDGSINSEGHFTGTTRKLSNPRGEPDLEIGFISPQTFRCRAVEAPGPPPASATSTGPWAAIAADGKGRWGYAVGQPSPDVAKNAALQGCGDSACTILDALKARCIAYAESRANGGYWYFGHFGADTRTVENNAMRACWKAAPSNSCALVKAACGD